MPNVQPARDCGSKRMRGGTDDHSGPRSDQIRPQSRAVLIVGGTHPAPVEALLEEKGFEDVQWWCGQRHDQFKRPIPRTIGLVIVLTDAINHSMMRSIRLRCRAMDIPVVCSRSRKSELQGHLDQLRRAG